MMASYKEQITRDNPTAFVFMVDRSYSMDEPIGGSSFGANKRKADAVADALNRVLYELTIRCGREEGVRNYFYISVIGYGGTVSNAIAGPLAGQDFVPIKELAELPLRLEDRQRQVDDGAGGTVTETVRFPVWFEAEASGGTPMCEALERARDLVAQWVKDHGNCFPPIVLNISDGEATDGSPESKARVIQDIATSDGNTLLFNLHLSSRPNQPVLFPESESYLVDDFAKQLYRISSVLPPPLLSVAQNEGFNVSESSRGFVFNADIASAVKFLDVGTHLEPQDR